MKGLPWEEAAERVENVAGWKCKTCNSFWGDGPSGERAARYCHAADAPCDCGNRREKHYTCCNACRAKHDAEKWESYEEVEWDGETPLVEYNSDTFIFEGADGLAGFLDCCEFDFIFAEGEEEVEPDTDEYRSVALEHVHLCLCRESKPQRFDLLDFIYDNDEEADIDAAGLAAEKAVNDWIGGMRKMYVQSNKRPSLASMRKHLGIAGEAGKERR